MKKKFKLCSIGVILSGTIGLGFFAALTFSETAYLKVGSFVFNRNWHLAQPLLFRIADDFHDESAVVMSNVARAKFAVASRYLREADDQISDLLPGERLHRAGRYALRSDIRAMKRQFGKAKDDLKEVLAIASTTWEPEDGFQTFLPKGIEQDIRLYSQFELVLKNWREGLEAE